MGMLNHYLICDHKDVIARWENDGKGWMLRIKDGFTRAATVATQIPEFGKYVLIEVGVEQKEDGLHLKNITAFKLQANHALHKLSRGDDEILSTILTHAELTPHQGKLVRELVQQKFLPHVWSEVQALLD